MAAMSTAQTATTLTPPSSSHGDANGFQWDFGTAPAGKPENQHFENKAYLKHNVPNGISRAPLTAQDGNAASFGPDMSVKASNGGNGGVNGPLSRSYSNEDTPDTMADGPPENEDDDDQFVKTADGFVHAGKRGKDDLEWSDEDSKWIHRDKLAKIESEELHAAGIILPQPRSRSRGPKRDRSASSHRKIGAEGTTRSRKNSSHALEPMLNGDAGDGDTPSRPMTGSRIPVPKKSSAHVPSRENSPEELDKDKRADAPKARSRSNSTTLRSLDPSAASKPTPVKKATTEPAAKRTTPPGGPRKPTGPSKSIPPEARGKPKPKAKNGSSGSNGRPNTRSGERELSGGSLGSKPMEGEPPWMISAYKPDPRLPPDQQLLPTVAKRLAQEKWEQEGKFGNVYDKEFRPLTDEGFLAPPAASSSLGLPASSSTENIIEQKDEEPEEWPLKSPEPPKSPASIGKSSTYSTMPKILDKPPSHSPLASPREPQIPMAPEPAPAPIPRPTQITRVPDVEEKEEKVPGAKKGGCGCCIVM